MSPGRADDVVIGRHLAALDSALTRLQRYSTLTREALGADLDLQWLVEHGLRLCCQNVLDIATHLTASAGAVAPDYRGAIDGLAHLGVLPADFATGLRGLAGFRNVLVHGYLEVDLDIVHDVLSRQLPDFARFAQLVRAWLAARQPHD